jgi:hypothetical protein
LKSQEQVPPELATRQAYKYLTGLFRQNMSKKVQQPPV